MGNQMYGWNASHPRETDMLPGRTMIPHLENLVLFLHNGVRAYPYQ